MKKVFLKLIGSDWFGLVRIDSIDEYSPHVIAFGQAFHKLGGFVLILQRDMQHFLLNHEIQMTPVLSFAIPVLITTAILGSNS